MSSDLRVHYLQKGLPQVCLNIHARALLTYLSQRGNSEQSAGGFLIKISLQEEPEQALS